GAGGMVQQIGIFLVEHETQIQRDTRAENHTALRLARPDYRRDRRQAKQVLHDRLAVAFLRDAADDIDIMDCLPAAAAASRDFQAHDLWQRAQLRRDGLGLRLRNVDAEAILVLLQELDALEDVLLRLRAEPADRGDLALLRRLLQFLQRTDAQLT